MPVNINIKKFSRSNEFKEVENTSIEDFKEIPKKKRGRPAKVAKYEEPIEEPVEEVEQESMYEEEEDLKVPVEDDDFLNELNNVNYNTVQPQKPQPEEEPKQSVSMEELMRMVKKKPSALKRGKEKEDDGGLFDDVGTELIGRDRRVLLAKIQQYKNLFPEELKKFKVKKNCSTSDLNLYLEEMSSIVDTSSVEQFMTDSIIQCLKLVEGASSYTKYDISGLTDLLKSNKQFHTLCKLLFIKYKVFSAVPPEMQMLMLISTTAYVCSNKNRKKKDIESYLNQEIKL